MYNNVYKTVLIITLFIKNTHQNLFLFEIVTWIVCNSRYVDCHHLCLRKTYKNILLRFQLRRCHHTLNPVIDEKTWIDIRTAQCNPFLARFFYGNIISTIKFLYAIISSIEFAQLMSYKYVHLVKKIFLNLFYKNIFNVTLYVKPQRKYFKNFRYLIPKL